MFCVVPLMFGVGLDTSQLPLPFPCLHSLLEGFLGHYYYSSASSALDNFLNHCRQFQNSLVKLVPSTVVKKVIAVAKGLDFIYDNSEVCLFGCGYLFNRLLCLLISISPPFFFLPPSSYLHLYWVFSQPTWRNNLFQSAFMMLLWSLFLTSSQFQLLFNKISPSGPDISSPTHSEYQHQLQLFILLVSLSVNPQQLLLHFFLQRESPSKTLQFYRYLNYFFQQMLFLLILTQSTTLLSSGSS